MTELSESPRLVEGVTLQGVAVYVRVLTVGEIRNIEAIGADEKADNVTKMVAFFLAGACKIDGTRFYTDNQVTDIENLEWPMVMQVAAEVIDINGLTPDDDEESEGN